MKSPKGLSFPLQIPSNMLSLKHDELGHVIQYVCHPTNSDTNLMTKKKERKKTKTSLTVIVLNIWSVSFTAFIIFPHELPQGLKNIFIYLFMVV